MNYTRQNTNPLAYITVYMMYICVYDSGICIEKTFVKKQTINCFAFFLGQACVSVCLNMEELSFNSCIYIYVYIFLIYIYRKMHKVYILNIKNIIT